MRTRKPPAPSRSARLTCSACGARLRPAHRFCPNCGAPAAPRGTGLQVSPETAVREDRRLVSVLFADLSGSTPLGERLDPEDLRRILGAFFAALVRPIQRYEGTVEKYMGDAVMAVFGAPVSHEDDAERTVRAALDMQRALTLLNDWLEREHGLRLALRVGISSGEVVGGILRRTLDRHGLGRRLDRHIPATVWADAVGAEIAARAQPTVLSGGTLHVLVQDHRWRDQLDAARSMVIERVNRRLGHCAVRALQFGQKKADGLIGFFNFSTLLFRLGPEGRVIQMSFGIPGAGKLEVSAPDNFCRGSRLYTQDAITLERVFHV